MPTKITVTTQAQSQSALKSLLRRKLAETETHRHSFDLDSYFRDDWDFYVLASPEEINRKFTEDFLANNGNANRLTAMEANEFIKGLASSLSKTIDEYREDYRVQKEAEREKRQKAIEELAANNWQVPPGTLENALAAREERLRQRAGDRRARRGDYADYPRD